MKSANQLPSAGDDNEAAPILLPTSAPITPLYNLSRSSKVTLAYATRIALLSGILITFAYFARAFLLPVMVAWVASMALKPPVTWMRARHIPTALAAGLVVLLVTGAFAGGLYYLGQPAGKWIQSSPQVVSKLKQKYESAFRPVAQLRDAAVGVSGGSTNQVANSPAPAPAAPETSSTHLLGTVFGWTGSALAGIGETIALLFLLLASGDLFIQKLVRVMPTLKDKKRAVDVSREIQQSISRYLFSIGLINLGLGIVVGTALYFLGMPNPALWGALAAGANFIPYFGPVMGMIVVAVAGLVAFDSIGRSLAPAGAYLAVHLIEANLVTPYALGRRFTLNPVIIFVFLIFCVWLWGVIGAFLAVPILVSVKVLCDRIESLSTLGEFLSE